MCAMYWIGGLLRNSVSHARSTRKRTFSAYIIERENERFFKVHQQLYLLELRSMITGFNSNSSISKSYDRNKLVEAVRPRLPLVARTNPPEDLVKAWKPLILRGCFLEIENACLTEKCILNCFAPQSAQEHCQDFNICRNLHE